MQCKNELCCESKKNQSIKWRRKRKIVYVPYFTLIIDEDCKQIGFVNFFFNLIYNLWFQKYKTLKTLGFFLFGCFF